MLGNEKLIRRYAPRKQAPAEILRLSHALLKKMGVHDVTNYRAYIVDSKSSPLSPAFTVSNSIYLTNDLLRCYESKHKTSVTKEEVTFIIAHELAHAVNKDFVKNIAMGVAIELCSAYITGKFGHYLPTVPWTNVKFKLQNYLLYYTLFKYIQYHEKSADLEAAKALGTAEAGISAFKKFGPDNPFDIWHPKLSRRIAYLTDWQKRHDKK